MSFFSNLRRRNVFRSALTYAVAAWLLMEVMELITGTFEAPPWVLKVFVSALVLGVVPVMIFSWLYEITPEGIKRESTDRPEHPAGTARKLDIAVLVMLTVAIGLFVQDRISRQTPVSAPTAEVLSTTAAPVKEGPPMVAVLPFTSSSMEGDSNFFAIGVHDDLLTQLAKLESMRVISRTSVLEYTDVKRNLREIGAALGADAILEGGVQTAGGRIRINAQLIDARTDEHLWAETYDRSLSPANIFDVQQEIARAIASALKATLTDQDSTQLTTIPTENMAAYRAFRRAMDIRNYGKGMMDPEYNAALEEAVALDPTYARAWAELVGALASKAIGLVKPDPELAGRVEQALEQVKEVAPGSAEYLIAQTYYIYYILRDYDHAHEVVSQAVARNPSDIQVLSLKTWIERRQGNFDARTESFRELARLDPGNPAWMKSLVGNLLITHRYDEALAEFGNVPMDEHFMSGFSLILLFQDGDFGRWLETMKAMYMDYGESARLGLWVAYVVNRDYAGAKTLLGDVEQPKLEEQAYFSTDVWLGILTYWLLNEQTQLQELVANARGFLENRMDANGDFERVPLYLQMALVTAAEGDAEETLRLVRRWDRLVSTDRAERVHSKDTSCQILGMVKATTAAVNCIRTGLKDPSYATPFLEPYLPFYDSIRDEPEFIELLDEIENESKR